MSLGLDATQMKASERYGFQGMLSKVTFTTVDGSEIRDQLTHQLRER